MNTILEKFVEAELFNEPMRAYFNGLGALEHEAFGRQVQRLRQVQLEPYGIADLVNIIHADQESRHVIIQVIECKRDMVNLHTYAQAKRYLAALKVALVDFVANMERMGFEVRWECVLVGHRLDSSSDLVFVLNDDPATSVFTYQRQGKELVFKGYGNNWGYHSRGRSNVHDKLEQLVKRQSAVAWQVAADHFADYYSKYDKQGNPL